jgi:hypothetical protein
MLLFSVMVPILEMPPPACKKIRSIIIRHAAVIQCHDARIPNAAPHSIRIVARHGAVIQRQCSPIQYATARSLNNKEVI